MLNMLLAGALTLASTDSARVVDGDGEPVASARVLRIGQGDQPDIHNGEVGDLWGAEITSTNADGVYTFPATDEPACRIIVISDAGFSESSVVFASDSLPDLTLQPYATLQGTVFEAGKPVPGAAVYLQHELTIDQSLELAGFGDRWLRFNADEKGQFEVRAIKPGTWEVARDLPWGPGTLRYPSHATKVPVTAAETATVTVGGTGRRVLGRLDLPDAEQGWDARLGLIQNNWGDQRPEPVRSTAEFEAFTWEDRVAFMPSAENRAYYTALRAALDNREFYVVTIQPDGSFAAPDVEPGEYEHVYLEVRQPGDGGATFAYEGSLTVPADNSEPLDLGLLPVTPIVNLSVGDAMPDVAFTDTAGNVHRLRNFEGKLVLLDAWATWCGPCLGETPHVQAVLEKFAGYDRLVVIGLSMDEQPELAAEYKKVKGLNWIDGYIGPADDTLVDDQLGIGGIPDIRLIGPDGKLLATDLRGEKIMKTVEDALAGV